MRQPLIATWVVLWMPLAAAAQTGITGTAKDQTGAALPGVTVEASSPALIEMVRTAITDGQGEYRIVDLRPGLYSVTFSLPGFSSVKREGIELSTNFMATVNAEVRVGAIEETVTVTGSSPVVDVQNVVQQKVINAELVETLPGARNQAGFAALIPGLAVQTFNRPAAQDVGGLSGERQMFAVHGGRVADGTLHIDGLTYNMAGSASSAFSLDPAEAAEFVFEIGAVSAETAVGGVRANMIPKDGGNLFKGVVFGNFSNGSLQSNNLTTGLEAAGLPVSNSLKKVWDLNPSFGGPIVKNKLWFHGSFRYWGKDEYVAGSYFAKDPLAFVQTPDLSRQHLDDSWTVSQSLRVTWDVNNKNKLSAYVLDQHQCQCHWSVSEGGAFSRIAPEATYFETFPTIRLYQAIWKSPATNRLLLEAGTLITQQRADWNSQPTVPAGTLSITELSTNTLYRNNTGQTRRWMPSSNYRAALNYVTGSHAFKGGLTATHGYTRVRTEVNGDMNLLALNGAPRAVILRNTPATVQNNLTLVGLYGQDQWTIKRLTLNLGVRFDYANGSVPETHEPATRFVPARNFAAVSDAPNWTDVSPRFGAAYDLFGTGKTAFKVTLSRYLDGAGPNLITAGVNPVTATVTRATRTWTDSSQDFLPQENELGPISDAAFGTTLIRTHYDTDLMRGFGKRGYNWETSAGVQHELFPQVSVNATYFRRSYGNFIVPDNLLVNPSDYDPYCITAPVDVRLPGGGGNQICGLFDIKPAKFGQRDDLVTFASNFGKQTEVYNGIDLTATARLPHAALLSGGANFGRTLLDQCDVRAKVDNPIASTGSLLGAPSGVFPASPSLQFCRQRLPSQVSFKLLGTVGLAWGLQAAATFQTLPGPMITASYVATNSVIAPSLGRNLAAGAAGTAPVFLVEPGTLFSGRLYQTDLRLAKMVSVGPTRLKGIIDLYNLFNASPVLVLNTTYGPAWQRPTYILPGRLIKFGVQVDF